MRKRRLSLMKQYKYLDILTAIAITILLATNITNGKIVQVGPLSVSVVVLFWPLTYLLSDIFTEVYGYAQARRVVWKLFMSMIVAAIIYQIVVYMPPAPGFEGNAAYVQIFSAIPRYVVAGWLTLLVGSFLNDFVMAKMKIWTKGKYLWTRTIGSTVVGEIGDTLIFYPIAFYGTLPNNVIINAMIGGYIIKVMVEIIFTPLTYWVVGKLKKLENEDYYDRNTDFNPFVFND
jgi:queuosine precursor transporter